jgi:hypothetical protein
MYNSTLNRKTLPTGSSVVDFMLICKNFFNLQRIYGDRNRDSQIYVLPNVYEEAKSFLENLDEAQVIERLEVVQQIIDGYETPYGLELLSTVHWIMTHHPETRNDKNELIHYFYSWNDRKKDVFKRFHIEKAWLRFRDAYNSSNHYSDLISN